jgi:hypothetical protein
VALLPWLYPETRAPPQRLLFPFKNNDAHSATSSFALKRKSMTTCTSRAAWLNLLRRLHFYIGLFVGPFIFVAALTGTLYVATPQLENWLYQDAAAERRSQPLSAQLRWRKRRLRGIFVCSGAPGH